MSSSNIRTNIRSKREKLSPITIKQDSNLVYKQIINSHYLKNSTKIAIYLSYKNEIKTDQIIKWCWDNSKKIYLPVIDPVNKNKLLFIRYTKKTKLVLNKFNIYEPEIEITNTISPKDLDLIITPLVAFDNNCNRLGTGGGFYDRALAPFKKSLKPIAIGIAYDFQQVNNLIVNSWDIPMQSIFTPKKIWHR